jgi:hypothetical protein
VILDRTSRVTFVQEKRNPLHAARLDQVVIEAVLNEERHGRGGQAAQDNPLVVVFRAQQNDAAGHGRQSAKCTKSAGIEGWPSSPTP